MGLKTLKVDGMFHCVMNGLIQNFYPCCVARARRPGRVVTENTVNLAHDHCSQGRRDRGEQRDSMNDFRPLVPSLDLDTVSPRRSR